MQGHSERGWRWEALWAGKQRSVPRGQEPTRSPAQASGLQRPWGMFGLRLEFPVLPGIRVWAGPPPRSAHQDPSPKEASLPGS